MQSCSSISLSKHCVHNNYGTNMDSNNDTPFIETSSITNKRFSPLLRQIFTSLGPIISTVASGTIAGYSATLLPQLQKSDSSIPITLDEASWIASVAPLQMTVGCLMGGVFMEKFGRKLAQLIGCIPFIIGWILISIANNITFILIGRFLTGFCSGWLGASVFVYIAEISDPKYRGFLLACTSLGISTGIFVAHLLGTFISWPITAAICTILPVFSFIVQALSPESPSWLLSKGQIKKAEIAFAWLRGCDTAARQEFESMLLNQNTSSTVGNYAWVNLRTNIRRAAFVKPLLILSGFVFIMQFSGVNAVTFYSVAIFKQTFGLGYNEYTIMLMVDVVRLIMSAVACVLLRRVGRRPLAIFSAIGTAVTLLSLSMFLWFAKTYSAELQSFYWIPLTLLIGYISFISVGLVPVPWCMIGELFPLSLRGLGSGITSSFCFLAFFVVVKTSPGLFSDFGADGTFLLYGCVALFGAIYLAIFLPETKNRTLQEIENSFQKA